MKYIRFLIMVGLITLVTACGYQFKGGGYINENVTRVAVAVFENQSSETNVGINFTNGLIREILEKTDTIVVDSARASHKITGTVNSITFSTLARTSTEKVVERQITAQVDMKLVGPDGKIIWSVKNFSSVEPYIIAEDKIDDESNKRKAVDKIARRIAERLVSQMKTNF